LCLSHNHCDLQLSVPVGASYGDPLVMLRILLVAMTSTHILSA